METKTVQVMENIHDRNDKVAAQLNLDLSKKAIFVANVMGAPGVGKTSTLIKIIERAKCKCYVIEGDIESDIDTKKLRALNIETVQINTGGACHLDSPLIADAASSMKLESGILFIENIGNLVCPAEFMIGEHIKILICSVTEGSDKPYKYPLAFEKADAILINKADLTPHVDFDAEYFTAGVRALNKTVPIFNVSSKTGQGFEEVAIWLENQAKSVISK